MMFIISFPSSHKFQPKHLISEANYIKETKTILSNIGFKLKINGLSKILKVVAFPI